MRELVIKVSPDGKTVMFLYMDQHPALGLGKLEVQRASNVRFDPVDQRWRVYICRDDGSEYAWPGAFVNRGEAIDCEIDILQAKLAAGELHGALIAPNDYQEEVSR